MKEFRLSDLSKEEYEKLGKAIAVGYAIHCDTYTNFFESDEFNFYFDKIAKYVNVNGFIWDENAKYGNNSPVTYKQLIKILDTITHTIDSINKDDEVDEWHYRGYRIELVCGQGCSYTITKLKE